MFVSLVLLVLVLSLIPQQSIPKVGFTRVDLVVHLAMYGALAYALSLSLYRNISSHTITLWKYPVLLGIFGFIIEILQKILPFNRFFSWEDAVCNFVGACSFYLWVYKIRG